MWGFFVGKVLAGAIHKPLGYIGQFRQLPSLAFQFGLLLKDHFVECVKLSLLEGKPLLQGNESGSFLWFFGHTVQRKVARAGKQVWRFDGSLAKQR